MPESVTDAPRETQQGSFTFDKFIVKKAMFEQLPRVAAEEGETRPLKLPGEINLSLQLQIQPRPPVGIVTLVVTVSPNLKWQPYRLEITVCGIFSSTDASPELFDLFCRTSVPTILFPYVRQIAHTLTEDAEFGRIQINPINLSDVLSKIDWKTESPVAVSSGPTEPAQPS